MLKTGNVAPQKLKVPKGSEYVDLALAMAQDPEGFQKKWDSFVQAVDTYTELCGAYNTKAKADEYMQSAKLEKQQSEELLATAQNQAQAAIKDKKDAFEAKVKAKEKQFAEREKAIREGAEKNIETAKQLAEREARAEKKEKQNAVQASKNAEKETSLDEREQAFNTRLESLKIK